MTDYRSLEPRELDAEIPCRVMGLKCALACPSLMVHEGDTWRPKDDYLDLNDDGSFKIVTYIPGGAGRLPIPHYSTDISSAMQVVEKMLNEGFEFDLMTETKDDKTRVVMCMAPNSDQFWASNTSLPRAICEAALAAIEVCEHKWIDATNEVVSGTAYCEKCGKLESLSKVSLLG